MKILELNFIQLCVGKNVFEIFKKTMNTIRNKKKKDNFCTSYFKTHANIEILKMVLPHHWFFLAVFFSSEKLPFAVPTSNLPVFQFAVIFLILKSTRFLLPIIKNLEIMQRF